MTSSKVLPYSAAAMLALIVGAGAHLACVPLLFWAYLQDPAFLKLSPESDPISVWLPVGICTSQVALHAGALVGLRRGATWGWFCAVTAAFLYLSWLCIPVAAPILLFALSTDTRTSFGIQKRS